MKSLPVPHCKRRMNDKMHSITSRDLVMFELTFCLFSPPISNPMPLGPKLGKCINLSLPFIRKEV